MVLKVMTDQSKNSCGDWLYVPFRGRFKLKRLCIANQKDVENIGANYNAICWPPRDEVDKTGGVLIRVFHCEIDRDVGEDYTVVANFPAFLLNDDGKTIEAFYQ